MNRTWGVILNENWNENSSGKYEILLSLKTPNASFQEVMPQINFNNSFQNVFIVSGSSVAYAYK